MRHFTKRVWFLGAALAMTSLSAWAGQLRAGAAKVSITPAQSEFPFVYEDGRGCEPQFAPGKSCSFVGVRDDIYARALMLSDGASSVVIVTVEATAVPDPLPLRAAIAKAVGVPVTNVLLAATHTHEVPLVKYHGGAPTAAQKLEIDRLETGAVAAARAAQVNLRSAHIAFARGAGWINVNNGDSVGTAGYNPNGPSDHALDVIKLDDDSGKPIALLLNYATHGEVMYRSVTKDNGYEVTGDVPGVVSATLEAMPGEAPVVLYTAGAEGDQLTLFKSLQGAEGALPAKDEGAAGWALLDEMSRRLTVSVLDVVGAMPLGASDVHIGAADGAAVCPGRRTSEDKATGKTVTEAAAPVSIPLHLIRINDIALVGVGGDLASEIGMAVKAKSPLAHTTIVSMAAGSLGYILADSSFARNSHGVMQSPIQPHCAETAIPAAVNGLVKSLPLHR